MADPKLRSRKTFTGCWTCRHRRLKCDEGRPNCLQCTAKGLECEGYSTKLQWVHETQRSSQKTEQRRRLLPASKLASLNEEEIEKALVDLDRPPSDTSSKSRGPFSVFRLEIHDKQVELTSNSFDHLKPLPCEGNEREHPLCSIHEPPVNSGEVEDIGLGILSEHDGRSVNQEPSQTSSVRFTTDLNCSIDPEQTDDLVITPTSQPSSSTSCLKITGNVPFSPALSGAPGGTPSHDPAPLYNCLSETFLSFEVKYLLHHYAHNVLPIFSPLDIKDNPWRRHQLSCALQCSIELEILGSSSLSKKTLLYSVLTISAYNLRNTLVHSDLSRHTSRWNQVASQYKGECLKLLEECVGKLNPRLDSGTYNELLAGMIAMVSIDVISGDIATSAMHLDACETLIRTQLTHDSHIVPGVSHALHGIFLYLITMQDATRVLQGQEDRMVESDAVPVNSCRLDEDLLSLILPRDEMAEFHWSSFELMYGFPVSLLLLLRKAAGLLDSLHRADNEASGQSTKSQLLLQVDQLEDEILEWPTDDAVARLDTAPVCQGNRLIMQHYTRAFHQALIIFYCFRACKMHHKHLQQYVQQVTFHLESAEATKKQFCLQSGSMLWPAFIAGSHTSDLAIRKRILEWLSLLDGEGTWASRLTKDALVSTWNRRKPFQGDIGFDVTNIMLV